MVRDDRWYLQFLTQIYLENTDNLVWDPEIQLVRSREASLQSYVLLAELYHVTKAAENSLKPGLLSLHFSITLHPMLTRQVEAMSYLQHWPAEL